MYLHGVVKMSGGGGGSEGDQFYHPQYESITTDLRTKLSEALMPRRESTQQTGLPVVALISVIVDFAIVLPRKK